MQAEIEIQKLNRRISQLEGQVAFLYKHLGMEFVPESAPTDDARIVDALKKGNKIDAIRLYREINNVGAQDAINAVNEMQGRLGL
jgi:ribosomal protein L7/L12